MVPGILFKIYLLMSLFYRIVIGFSYFAIVNLKHEIVGECFNWNCRKQIS